MEYANIAGSGACEERELTVLQEYIQTAGSQNRELDEIKQLFELAICRLDDIANRLNFSDYPKNQPRKCDSPNPCESEGRPPAMEGVVPRLGDLLSTKGNLLYKLSNETLTELNTAINFLEKHI